jgi:hypothetical protein
MQETQQDLLVDELTEANMLPRKKMLPLWIKIFAWIFLIAGFFIPVILILGVAGYAANQSLYGLESNNPFSLMGIVITTLFALKAVTAFGLLKEKDWAIKLGIADGAIGVVICVLVMLFPIINPEAKFSFRLELAVITPYLLKLQKIKNEWESFVQI